MSLLLVEDDAALAPLVVRHLRDSGFEIRWATEAAGAWAQVEQGGIELVILDVMLPGEDGLSLCRRLHKRGDLGIIMVTARGRESDRILGLDLGADDYLAKPFSLWELEARIRSVLRRYSRAAADAPACRSLGPVSIDRERRSVSLNGMPVELTRSEFDILERLTDRPGHVLTRDDLLSCVKGGQTEALDRAVDTHVSNLRRKLEDNPREPRYIKTVWGVGYRFEVP
ncbi:MAG: response regulator transcription factor [Gammaproteobacteria bacterium]|nr:response regulator transcription factor [Gammaproteobacteria bacterium]